MLTCGTVLAMKPIAMVWRKINASSGAATRRASSNAAVSRPTINDSMPRSAPKPPSAGGGTCSKLFSTATNRDSNPPINMNPAMVMRKSSWPMTFSSTWAAGLKNRAKPRPICWPMISPPICTDTSGRVAMKPMAAPKSSSVKTSGASDHRSSTGDTSITTRALTAGYTASPSSTAR